MIKSKFFRLNENAKKPTENFHGVLGETEIMERKRKEIAVVPW